MRFHISLHKMYLIFCEYHFPHWDLRNHPFQLTGWVRDGMEVGVGWGGGYICPSHPSCFVRFAHRFIWPASHVAKMFVSSTLTVSFNGVALTPFGCCLHSNNSPLFNWNCVKQTLNSGSWKLCCFTLWYPLFGYAHRKGTTIEKGSQTRSSGKLPWYPICMVLCQSSQSQMVPNNYTTKHVREHICLSLMIPSVWKHECHSFSWTYPSHSSSSRWMSSSSFSFVGSRCLCWYVLDFTTITSQRIDLREQPFLPGRDHQCV